MIYVEGGSFMMGAPDSDETTHTNHPLIHKPS